MPNIPRDEAQINEDIAKMMEQVDAGAYQDRYHSMIEWSEIIAAFVHVSPFDDEAAVKADVDARIPFEEVPQMVEALRKTVESLSAEEAGLVKQIASCWKTEKFDHKRCWKTEHWYTTMGSYSDWMKGMTI